MRSSASSRLIGEKGHGVVIVGATLVVARLGKCGY